MPDEIILPYESSFDYSPDRSLYGFMDIVNLWVTVKDDVCRGVDCWCVPRYPGAVWSKLMKEGK